MQKKYVFLSPSSAIFVCYELYTQPWQLSLSAVIVVQLLSHVPLFETPWTAAC